MGCLMRSGHEGDTFTIRRSINIVFPDNLRLERASFELRTQKGSERVQWAAPAATRYFTSQNLPAVDNRTNLEEVHWWRSSADASFTFCTMDRRYKVQVFRDFKKAKTHRGRNDKISFLRIWFKPLFRKARSYSRSSFLISVAIFADIQMKVNLMVKWK